ncbi:MAG: type VI secretion system baseplate subunit TssF, partial [Pseudomonas aeruginosa]|nr:type VI secretion system baseplate subunit TssF [Pseudomonas aeruginosa]
MNPRLLEYYNQELQHIRESAAEFAEEFPKIAGRLSLSGFECADPYVERLLEGFAYLTARVQLKLDAEYPTFTHNLLEIAYPHYLAPTPSMTVVQLRPDPNEGALSSGFSVERGASLRGQLGPDDQTACEYRTAHPVTLWPLEVAQADYFGNPAAVLGRLAASEPRAKAGLRIRLRSGAGIPFDSLSLDALPLYLHGADEQPYRLYEQLLGNACAVFVRAPDNAWVERLPTSSLRARGFDDEDALLPVVPRAFQGYRLLQEYFALPARFLFVEFSGLNRALRRCHGEELELVVLFGKHDQRLEGTVGAEQLVPFCTPAINLFPRRCDRIHLSDRVNEHHVIVDRTRPLDFEVHSLQQVSGHGSGPEQPFQPFYAVRDPARYGREQAYFSVRREPRVLSSKQRRKGPRSTYVGSETFVALVDETLVFSAWPGQGAWQDKPLESHLYGSRQAGEYLPLAIKRLLDERAPASRDLANVYLQCLILGFRGRLRGPRGEALHEKWRQALFAFAWQREADAADLGRRLEQPAAAPPRRLPVRAALPDGFRNLLNLGGEVSLCNPLLLNWMRRLREAIPGHAVRVEIGQGADLLKQLEQGALDAALVYQPEYWPGLQVEQLLEEKLVMV